MTQQEQDLEAVNGLWTQEWPPPIALQQARKRLGYPSSGWPSLQEGRPDLQQWGPQSVAPPPSNPVESGGAAIPNLNQTITPPGQTPNPVAPTTPVTQIPGVAPLPPITPPGQNYNPITPPVSSATPSVPGLPNMNQQNQIPMPGQLGQAGQQSPLSQNNLLQNDNLFGGNWKSLFNKQTL